MRSIAVSSRRFCLLSEGDRFLGRFLGRYRDGSPGTLPRLFDQAFNRWCTATVNPTVRLNGPAEPFGEPPDPKVGLTAQGNRCTQIEIPRLVTEYRELEALSRLSAAQGRGRLEHADRRRIRSTGGSASTPAPQDEAQGWSASTPAARG
jgi:hypothetical protein